MRLAALMLLAAAALGAAVFLPPLPQPLGYHDFADRRGCLGLPNCLDVLSNPPLLLVGLWALGWLRRQGGAFLDPAERWPYLCFFAAVALCAAASAWYHLAPGNGRLVWDRLTLAAALAALVGGAAGDRFGARAGRLWFFGMLLAGTGSVAYWALTLGSAAEDVRPYALAQAYAVLTLVALALLYPARYRRGTDLLAAAGWYGLAKLAEHLDRPLFALGQLVSGHTLKHLLAAAAAYWVLRMLQLREAT